MTNLFTLKNEKELENFPTKGFIEYEEGNIMTIRKRTAQKGYPVEQRTLIKDPDNPKMWIDRENNDIYQQLDDKWVEFVGHK